MICQINGLTSILILKWTILRIKRINPIRHCKPRLIQINARISGMHIDLTKILIFIRSWADRQRINWLLNMLLLLGTLAHPRPSIYNITIFLVKFASTLKKIIVSILDNDGRTVAELLLLPCVVERTVRHQRVSNWGYVTLLLHIVIGCLQRVPVYLYWLVVLIVLLSCVFLWWSFYI